MQSDVIAVANQKGGVGKTTTAVALAAESQDLGWRTLLVDMDPQGTATAIWGWHPEPGLDDLYSQLSQLAKGMQIRDTDGLYGFPDKRREALLPATLDLANMEIELQSAFHREHMLERLLIAVSPYFDRIILDCPPSFGLLTINALTAATRVVIPCVPDYVSVQGLGRLWDTIRLVQTRINPALMVAGVLVTRYQQNTLHHREFAGDIRDFCQQHSVAYLGTVPNTIKVADAAGGGLAVTRYADGNGARDAYKRIAARLYGGTA